MRELDYKKKAEHRRIDAFELWCWRRLLRVPWTARRSNPSILKEISPEYSLEGLMLKLKLQYFGHLMRRTDSLEKILMLGKIEGWRRRGRQRMRWLDGITDSMDMNFINSGGWWCTGKHGMLQFMELQNQTQLRDGTWVTTYSCHGKGRGGSKSMHYHGIDSLVIIYLFFSLPVYNMNKLS